MSTRGRLLAFALMVFMVVPMVAVEGHHQARVDNRIVEPYGMPVNQHIPVAAGYEPVPVPMFCDYGTVITNPVFSDSFEGSTQFTYTTTPLASNPAANYWHVSTYEGPAGTIPVDTGHDGPGRLWFGNEVTKVYSAGGNGHVAGVAQTPWITLSSIAPSFVSYNTKWRVEWLKGYDHLWVELEDSAGNLHLLCTNNAYDRADPTGLGGSSMVQSCSPYHANPCPPGVINPGWETRSAQIPASLAGQQVRVRFTFDSADGLANGFIGWQLDDVVIGTTA
jgi:hypothetical protein